ncbi:hypothetical protein M1293_01435 [Candidatus Parvarchaeota archaeon]|nr:hypothetical protein [Candidatus Parvarchaeota archaeon]
MITEKISKRKKFLLLGIVIAYFFIGFFLILFFAGRLIGANAAGILALAYIGAGWYLLIRKNGLFYLMRIKHD